MIKEIEIFLNDEIRNFLIVPVHLPSKVSPGQVESINSIFDMLEQKLDTLKKDRNTEDIIFIGDFNLNPHEFEDLMSFKVSNCALGSSIITNQGRERNLYYNPSYHLLGNFDQITLGSHWFGRSWHLLDQVIMTKSLVSLFDKKNFKIVELETNHLLDKGYKPKISDHMPISIVFN